MPNVAAAEEILVRIENLKKKESEINYMKRDIESHILILNKEKNRIKDENNNEDNLSKLKKQISEIESELSNLDKTLDLTHEQISDQKTNLNIISNRILNDLLEEVQSRIERMRRIGTRRISRVRDSKVDQRIISLIKLFEYKDIEFGILYFIKYAEKKGLNIDKDFLRVSSRLFGQDLGIVPSTLSDFINSYLKDMSKDEVLDPWANACSLIVPFAENYPNSKSTALIENLKNKKLSEGLNSNLGINWELQNRFGDILVDLYGKKNFDVVMGCIPLVNSSNMSCLPIEENNIILRDKIHYLRMLYALRLLKPRGVAFFLVPSNFLLMRRNSTVFNNLKRFGLYIDAVLELPNPIFSNTAVNCSLIIIRKEDPKNLFVGELSSEIDSNHILLENLKSRREGKIPQLGALTNIESYYSFRSFIAKRESLKIAKKLGSKSVKLSEITKETNSCRFDEELIEKPNSVYIPRIVPKNVVSSIEKLETRQDLYVQLVLDPEKAIADYVTHFFSTELGQKIIESISIERRILRKFLMDIDIYLPDLNTQIRTLETDALITDISTQLESYKHNLWKSPQNNGEIKRYVELFNVGNGFKYWINSLPYPLSSILLAFEADSNVEHKIRYLIHFFEALSEFNSTVMLSAIVQNKNLCQNEFLHCITNSKYPEWYHRPTFGNWNHLGRCLATKIRNLLNNEETEEICFKIFGNPTRNFLEMITNKEIYKNILREAMDYRNKWLGHGPPVDENENKRRLKLLVNLLSKTRQIISYNYENVLLIQTTPNSMSFDGGIFTNNVKVLKGGLPFKDHKTETLKPLIEEKLYFIHENQHEAIELLPFFKVMESPKKEHNTCYFYNRFENIKEGEEIRMVSYHFNKEAEVPCAYEEFKPLFSILSYNNEV